MSFNVELLNYLETLNQKFPNTAFKRAYSKNGQYLLSSFTDFKSLYFRGFLTTPSIHRTPLFNSNEDELRIDLDEEEYSQNIEVTKKLQIRLQNLGITKYLIYYSGNKGIHITFRFRFQDSLILSDCDDRTTLRHKLYDFILSVLSPSIKKDFQPNISTCCLTCEGYSHKKTQKKKLLLNNYLNLTPHRLNIKYLTDEYLNILSNDIYMDMLNHSSKLTPEFNISIPKTRMNPDILEWHLNRFKEIYLSATDGHKRIIDTLRRFIILNIPEDNQHLVYYKLLFDLGIAEDTPNSLKDIQHARATYPNNNICFICPEVLSPKYFYSTLPEKYKGISWDS